MTVVIASAPPSHEQLQMRPIRAERTCHGCAIQHKQNLLRPKRCKSENNAWLNMRCNTWPAIVREKLYNCNGCLLYTSPSPRD
eukprot:14773210-Alexandrium_andersonii.AAC.1